MSTRLSRRRFQFMESLEPRWMLAGDVVINEFMAANSGILQDLDGDSSDWIELRNVSDQAVQLDGWYLTDDAEDLTKWRFPEVTLPASDYLMVFASGKQLDSGPELHTNFRIRAAGEFLSLTLPDGVTLASAFAPTFPPQQTDVSFGLPNNEMGSSTFLLEPTPGAANSIAMLSETVTASHTDPTFVDAFSLTLSGAKTDQHIVYTLDGSVPTATSSIYEDPISIDERRQVRARVVGAAGMGRVQTWGYSQLTEEVAQFASKIPIMLIDNFGAGPIPNKGFPDQTGADTFQLPRQSASVTLFETNEEGASNLVDNVDLHERIGIRVRGAFSSTFDEPGYSLEFWDETDSDKDIAPLDFGTHSDWVLYAPNPSYDRTLMDNTFLFSVSDQMGHWAPSFRYVETFVNTGGKVSMDDHVGLYVIEDKVNRGPGRIDFEKMSPDGTSGGWLLTVNRMDAVSADDSNAVPQYFHTAGPNGVQNTAPNSPGRGDDIPRQYNAFINFDDPNGYKINPAQRSTIEQWFADMEDVLYDRTSTAWDDPLDGYARYIDVESFIDYFILNNISNNGDGFLLSMWLYNPDPHGQGKLTMGPIWDADLRSFEGNADNRIRRDVDRLWYTRMFEDPEFQQQYIDRWFELRQSTLTADNIDQVITKLQSDITTEVAERDGVSQWQVRVTAMKSWLERRLPLIDRLYSQPPQLEPNRDGFTLTGTGDFYYTLDGSDPRSRGGNPADTANLLVGSSLAVPDDFRGTVRVRALHRGSWSAPMTAQYLPGDVNLDGLLDAADIDALMVAVGDESQEAMYDLDFDGDVDADDTEYLVKSIFQTRAGDTNLDRRVDFTDFLTLSANFGKQEGTWSQGNFNANTSIEFTDFLLLSANFGLDAA